jgi:hypothetical protein
MNADMPAFNTLVFTMGNSIAGICMGRNDEAFRDKYGTVWIAEGLKPLAMTEPRTDWSGII